MTRAGADDAVPPAHAESAEDRSDVNAVQSGVMAGEAKVDTGGPPTLLDDAAVRAITESGERESATDVVKLAAAPAPAPTHVPTAAIPAMPVAPRIPPRPRSRLSTAPESAPSTDPSPPLKAEPPKTQDELDEADDDPTRLDRQAPALARELAQAAGIDLAGKPVITPSLTAPSESEEDDEDPTRLDARAHALARGLVKVETPTPERAFGHVDIPTPEAEDDGDDDPTIGPRAAPPNVAAQDEDDEENEDPTKLDPQAQALALDALRKMNARPVAPIAPENVVPTPRRNVAAKVAESAKPVPVSGEGEDDDEDDDENAETGLGFDKQDLFGGLEAQRSTKGGTALLNISPNRQQWSALPDDVRVFIKEDALESLPEAAVTPSRRVAIAFVLAVVSGLAMAAIYTALVR